MKLDTFGEDFMGISVQQAVKSLGDGIEFAEGIDLNSLFTGGNK